YNYFNQTQTSILKGISILLILVHHLTIRLINPNYLKPLLNVGFLGVAIFFFISGYGLISSYLKDKNYLNNFFSKRVARVYIPFIVTNIFIGITSILIFNESYSITEIFSTSIFLKNITSGQVFWYINATILFYIVFFLSIKFSKTTTKAIVIMFIYSIIYIYVCRIQEMGIYWYNTAFAFPFGVLFAYKKENILYKIKTYYNALFIICLIGFVIIFLISFEESKNKFIFDTISSILFIFLIILLNYKLNIKSKLLDFIGSISFEIYLVHQFIIDIFYGRYNTKQSLSFYLLVLIIIGVSFLLNMVSKVICEKVDSLNNN
ncbi:MAG: acyltransferase, partial [Sedimentibacter sp.]